MKKINSFLLGTLALTGLMVSCAKEPIAQTENAAVQEETGDREITTNFVLSINTGEGTRQTAANVQRDNNFLGIDSTRILAFTTGLETPYVNSSTTAARKVYTFDVLYSNGQITPEANQTSSSNRILQLSIPLQTDAMLFYAKAANDRPGRQQGMVFSHMSSTPSEIHFDLCSRIGDNMPAYQQSENLMAFVLNRVMGSEVPALGDGENYMGYTSLPAISWQSLGIQYEINIGARTGVEKDLSALEETLAKAYSLMTRIKTGEYRSGSSEAVQRMVYDLAQATASVVAATPGNAAEANAHRLAVNIHYRIDSYFDSSHQFYMNSTLKDLLVNEKHIMTEAEWNASYALASDLNKFPYADFFLPIGVAQLQYDDENKFSFKNPNQAILDGSRTFDPTHYMYPAELLYYVNSPLRVTDKQDLTVADYPNGVNPWNDDVTAGNKWAVGMWKKNGKVQSTTRGVAIRDNINYGVAMLQTNVAWTAGLDSLQDNRKVMTDNLEEDRKISINDANLQLHGLLIGGQNACMGWQYLRRGASGDPANFDYVIYDDHIANTAVPTASPNYTLVFDNYDALNPQGDVNVALEFQNNGDDFWGKDNIIPSGGYFYLLAKLQVGNGGAITWPSNYQVPPIYGVDGEAVPEGKTAGMSKQVSRVFIQDFMTKVTFRLGPTSLHNAYLSVPDLRSTQMSLGLSVDIEWNNGFQFDITL
ncbi:MAG: hypothetical protein J6Y32_07380 [Bacteroidales bacterium]|nr:hypothetical protein [Bacteroidales bacterium]